MKLSKRILSAFLAILMVCSVITVVSAANVTFTDVSGHWASKQIQYLVDKGVLNGYKQPNGTYTFNPNGDVTRAEFIKMLDETFGLKATASINFNDVKTSDWFHPYFAKAAAQGYLLNYGTSVNPNGKISREEATALLVRYLDLPASEKTDPSFFADYYAISDNFRDYVLRGVYGGLITGYNENGATYFKPQGTLTRAEALTILYRAAGCVFKTNAYSRDTGAADTNNVITNGNVVLNGITLNGRVIVSEGAASEIVSIYNCNIPGTLYIRGTADVVLDNCTIKNVVIENGCKLNIQNTTEIESVTVYGQSTLYIYSGIILDILDIKNGADNTTVSGDGAIRKAYINAAGFRSSMTPSEFQIGNNLTASFASTQYQGSSDAQDSFTMTPFITSDDSSYYLNLFPAVDGTVYYYFTNGSTAPTAASFDSYFDVSTYTGSLSVEAGEMRTEKTYSASSVGDYDYVVLQLQESGRKYAPVIIPNTSTVGTGFSTDPYLADASTIKFMAAQAGTLYWFYAKDGSKLTQAEFIVEYANTDNALTSESIIGSNRTLSIGLSDKYLKNYDYIAIMLKAANGSYYTPVIVSAGDNGFKTEPTIKNVGTISFTSAIDGDLYYYYSKNANLPTSEDFKGEYNAARHADHMSVTKDRDSSFDYNTDYSEDYPYLILSLRNSNKEYLQPVAVNIDYRTGFRNAPEVLDSASVRFRTEEDGEVLYYYTKSDTVPSIDEFRTNYDSAGKSYKGSMEVDSSYETIDYNQKTAETYPYMAIMFIDDQDREYSPVIVELNSASDHGFTLYPYIIDNTVYFKTAEDGEVWYYYDKTEYPLARSEFESEYSAAYSIMRGTQNVTGNSLTSFKLNTSNLDDGYTYIYLAFLPENNSTFYYPLVLDATKSDTSGTGMSNLSVSSERVSFKSEITGSVYYYYTDDVSSIEDSTDFKNAYQNTSSSQKNSKSVTSGETRTINFYEVREEKYLVLCIVMEDSYNNNHYFTPVIVNLKEGTSSSTDGTIGQPGMAVSHNSSDRTITLQADYNGTVKVYLITDSIFLNGIHDNSVIDEFTIIKTLPYSFDYSDILSRNSGVFDMFQVSKVSLGFQLESGGEVYSRIEVDINYNP